MTTQTIQITKPQLIGSEKQIKWANDIIDNIANYIEPILLIFSAAMVLLRALGIFMPMWDMAKAVKN